jgi:hypothetical protein
LRPLSVRAKRGLSFATIATAALMAAPGMAQGAIQANAPVTQTQGPDVLSAALVPSLPNTAEICFDREIDNASLTPLGPSLGMIGYRAMTGTPNTSARVVSPSDPSSCGAGRGVLAEFPAALALGGTRLDQHTAIAVPEGMVADLDGNINVPSQAALSGSTLQPVNGATVGPKLVSATIHATLNNITYTYSRPIDATFAALNPGNFGFETQSGQTSGVFGTLPALAGAVIGIPDLVTGGVVGVAGNSVTVHFPRATDAPNGASVTGARRIFSNFGAVNTAQFDLIGGFNTSTLDVITRNGGDTERPDLIGATPVANQPGVWDLKYDTTVITVPIGQPLLTWAIDEEGTPYPGIVAGRPGNKPDVVRVAFLNNYLPNAAALAQNIVRVTDLGGAAIDFMLAEFSSPGSIDVRTVNQTAGFSSAPDLASLAIDRNNDTATWTFDEPATAVSPSLIGLPSINAQLLRVDSAFNLANELLALNAIGALMGTTADQKSLITSYTHDQALHANGGVFGQWFGGGINQLLPVADPTNLVAGTGAMLPASLSETVAQQAQQPPAAAPQAPAVQPTAQSQGASAAPVAQAAVQSTSTKAVTAAKKAKKKASKKSKASKKRKARKSRKSRRARRS